MQYFQSLPRDKRRDIAASQGLIYKGISFSTIGDIYDVLYERSVGGEKSGLSLYTSCEVESVEELESGSLLLTCLHTQLDQRCELETDALVAATGYVHDWPEWFQNMKGSILAVDDKMIVLFKKTLRLYVVIKDKVEFSFKMPRFFSKV